MNQSLRYEIDVVKIDENYKFRLPILQKKDSFYNFVWKDCIILSQKWIPKMYNSIRFLLILQYKKAYITSKT